MLLGVFDHHQCVRVSITLFSGSFTGNYLVFFVVEDNASVALGFFTTHHLYNTIKTRLNVAMFHDIVVV